MPISFWMNIQNRRRVRVTSLIKTTLIPSFAPQGRRGRMKGLKQGREPIRLPSVAQGSHNKEQKRVKTFSERFRKAVIFSVRPSSTRSGFVAPPEGVRSFA